MNDYEMIETIELFIQEASSADSRTQCQLLLKTESFFQAALKINQESSDFQRLLNCINSFFQLVNSHLSFFLVDKKNSESLANLIIIFTNSPISTKIGNDLGNFVIKFISSDNLNSEVIGCFSAFFKLFFSNPNFVEPFKLLNGLNCIWQLLFDQSKNDLFEEIFQDLQQTINLYFQSDDSNQSAEFITTITKTINDIPPQNSSKAFQFISDLISTSQSNILLFIQKGGFQAFNQYIIDHDDLNLLSYYNIFMSLDTSLKIMPDTQNDVHPIIGEFIKLIEFPNISESIQKNALKILLKSLSIFSENYCPLQPESLYAIASSINISQNESILLLFQISQYLMSHFDFDITLVIPLFFTFYSYEFFIKNDVQPLFEVLKLSKDSFVPFVPLFFSTITKNSTPEMLFCLIEKYPTILEFLNSYINNNIFDDHLLTLFYSISPMLKDRKMYSKVLLKLLLQEDKVNFLFELFKSKDKDFANSFLNEISLILFNSKKLRNCPHNLQFLNKIDFENTLPSIIFNVIIGLSGKFFNKKFDTFIVNFLKKNEFFKATQEELKNLAFGVFQNMDSNSNISEHLVFPSLLPFIGDKFKILLPYDQWICGQYGIDLWISETGKTIDQFPSIEDVANRYLLPHHIPMILENPELISKCCDNSFQMNPVFEFASGLPNTMISFQLPNSTRSVSFWFSINSLPKEKLRIVNFYNFNLIIENDSIYLNESEPYNVVDNRWYHIVLIANDKVNSCTGYVDGKSVFRSNSLQDNSLSFFDTEDIYSDECGNDLKSKFNLKFCSLSVNPVQWLIGGAIRTYSQNITSELIDSLFSSGVSNTVKNLKPAENFFVTADNFIELFKVTNSKYSSLSLSENSRPSIAFSFLRHVQNAYNGGELILNLIYKLLDKEFDENVHKSIDFLIESLCKMQNLQYTGWKLNTFAIYMSTLFYLKPSIFTDNILSIVFSCFSSSEGDKIKWKEVLILICDFGIFNSSSRSFVISKLYEFLAQYNFDDNISDILLNFIFHVLFFFDKELDESEFEVLFSLIGKFNPTISQISYMLQASLNFNDYLVNPTLHYDKELFDGRIYKRLYIMLVGMIDNNFDEYHLIYILNPHHSFELIKKILLINTKKKISPNYSKQIIMYCFLHSDLKESWAVLLNVLLTIKTKKYIGQFIESPETLIANSSIESESLSTFVLSLSFLSIQVLNNPDDKFWNSLWNSMFSFALSNTSLFNCVALSNNKVMSSIIQLLSCGLLSSEKVVFPFCPSLENPDDIVSYSIQKGQPFPNGHANGVLRIEIFNFKPKCSNDVLNSITKIIPQAYHLPPPYSDTSISSHKKMYDINFVNKTLNANKKYICNTWHNFCPKAKYSAENVIESNVFKDIISYVVKICTGLKVSEPKSKLKRASSSGEIISSANESSSSLADSTSLAPCTNDEDDENQTNQNEDISTSPAIPMGFSSFFLNIVTLIESIDSKYSLNLISKFVIEILQFLVSKNKTSLFIIDFVCSRIKSGLFKPEFLLQIITLLLSIPMKGKAKISKSVLQVLIFVSNNILDDEFPAFLTLFLKNSDKIFHVNNYENNWFIVLLFEILYNNRSSPNCTEQITQISKVFSESLKQSLKKIKDKEVLQFRNSIINGLKELMDQSKRSTYTINEYLSQLIKSNKEEFINDIKAIIIESLEKGMIQRNLTTAQFYQSSNEFLETYNNNEISARSISSIIRFNDRRILLLDLNYFFRIRERLFTKYPFSNLERFKDKVTTKTVSLLNDPINPSRRFEPSPMIYQIPPFPSSSKTVTSVMPYPLPEFNDILTILPQSLYEILSLDYQSFEVMVLHQLKPQLLSFSYHFEIDDELLLTFVLNFITHESKEKVKFLNDASILYGISPLNGVLIIDSKRISFIEGLKLTKNGCSFNENINKDMNEIIYEFYVTYMNSGYFGKPFTFFGHPTIQVPTSQIISSMPHLWLQKEIAVELNFLLGWTFIFVTYNNSDLLSKIINELTETNINKTNIYNKYPSPINSSKLLRLSQKEVTKLWSDGNISNFTYLLYLNKISGRSFVDFSQFSIFPWIISDYSTTVYESIPRETFRNLALPMGQIGPERTPRFQLFFENSKYFYGTHYMHLGVVLFYLFRVDPFSLFSIYFHHGWDHPSRLFSDFGESWLSAAHVSQNDVKELVPQMFRCPEFLTNISHLPLSSTQQNQVINVENVKLGKWSNNPKDFTRIMSSEIESEQVSKTINNWIDLIFGMKSRGDAAIEAKNVFPPLCYSENNNSNQSTGDKISVEDEVERKAAEASIINFGQCPRQIFKSLHPTKTKIEQKKHLLSDPKLILYQSLNCNASFLPINDAYMSGSNIFFAPQKGVILNSTTTVIFSHSMSAIIAYNNSIIAAKAKLRAKSKGSIKRKGSFRDESSEEIDDEDEGQINLKSDGTSSLPKLSFLKSFFSFKSEEADQVFSSFTSSYQEPAESPNQVPQLSPESFFDFDDLLLNSSTNSMNASDFLNSDLIDFGSNSKIRVLFNCPTSVDFICKSSDGSLLCLFLKEGSFSVYQLIYEKGEAKSGSKLMNFSTTSSDVITASVSIVHFLAVVVCNDDKKGKRICRYDLGLKRELDSIDADFIVRKIIIDDHAATIIACGDEKIAIFTVSGEKIAERRIIESEETSNDEKANGDLVEDPPTRVTSVAVSNLEEYVENRFFATGHLDGFVRFWVFDVSQSAIFAMKEIRVCDSAIDLISISSDEENSLEFIGSAQRMIAISSSPSCKMFSFEFYGSSSKNLIKDFAIKCAICGRYFDEIKQKPNICYECHRFYCKDCVQKTGKKALILNDLCKTCQDIKNKLTTSG